MMPISTRGEYKGGDESNQVAMTALPLATDIADPPERLLAVRRATRRGKSISASLGKDLPARLIEVLPAYLVEQVMRSALVPLVNVTVSNVHGPDEALYMAGAKLQMFTPVSIVIDGVGLNLTGLSYNGTLWVCFVSCRKMLPDPSVFVQCLNQSFDELVAAAAGKRQPDAETGPAAPRTRRAAAAAPAPVTRLRRLPRSARAPRRKPPAASKPAPSKPAARRTVAKNPPPVVVAESASGENSPVEEGGHARRP